MNSYERLLEEAAKDNIIVLERKFKSDAKGLCKGNKIAIRQNIPTLEKTSVLAEELGHYHTTVGNILNQQDDNCRKQERKARRWAYEKQIGLNGLVRALKKELTSLYEIAEYLEVSEEFLLEALEYYKEKWGCSMIYDGYEIIFEPALRLEKCESCQLKKSIRHHGDVEKCSSFF